MLITLSIRRFRQAALLAAALWLALPFAIYFVCGTEGLEKWLTKNALPIGLMWNGCLLAGLAGLWKGSTRMAGLSLTLALLVGVTGSACDIVIEAEAGVALEPDDDAQLYELVVPMADEPDWRNSLAQRGRQYVAEHYTRDCLADQYLELLESTL